MRILERDRIGGLAKGLRVIEAFTAEKTRLTITEAAAAAKLDRATARRCLLTLADLGYCDYDGKFFSVTARILRLGAACLASMPLPRIVQPLIDKLSQEIGESTSVSVLDETEIVYIARAAQTRVMSISLMPGSRLPAYCTSMGRVLLSALDPGKARDVLLSSALEARTAHTQIDPDRLMEEIAMVRRQGHAAIDQEVEIGLRSVAVPMLNGRGQTIAALNAGFAVRQETMADAVQRLLPSLMRTRDQIRSLLT
jgi:IclR family pca regulon transcriptional regulator